MTSSSSTAVSLSTQQENESFEDSSSDNPLDSGKETKPPDLTLVPSDFRPSRIEPLLPAAPQTDDGDKETLHHRLFDFFINGREQEDFGEEQIPLQPALLSKFLGKEPVRTDFPLWVAPDPKTIPDGLFCPVSELFSGAIAEFAPEPEASRILKDSLPVLEEHLQQLLLQHPEPLNFDPLLKDAFENAKKRFGLSGEDASRFQEDLQQLRDRIPRKGFLLRLDQHTPLHLLANLLKALQKEKLESFCTEIQRLRHHLQELLQVDRSKQPEHRQSNHLDSALGQGTRFINTSELSGVLQEPATLMLDEKRRERIIRVLGLLERFEETFLEHDAHLLVHEEGQPKVCWEEFFPNSMIYPVLSGKGSLEAGEVCIEVLAEMAKFFTALRIARLEEEDAYQMESHDRFFEHFDWKMLSEEELQLAPPVILIENESTLQSADGAELAELLRSSRPVKVMLLKNRTLPAFVPPESDLEAGIGQLRDSLFNFRPEPGYFAVSQRKALVLQSSPVRLEHCVTGMVEALQNPLPAMLHILTPDAETREGVDPFLWSGAAIESREFPLFLYKPGSSKAWGSRFSAEANLQADTDWPSSELNAVDENHEAVTLPMVFTPADFAALDETWRKQLMPVPKALSDDESLISLADYLELSREDAYEHIPFIWQTDQNNVLRRTVVSFILVQICRERLDFWRLIQEMGGTHSFHALQAAQDARDELSIEHEAQIAEMLETHAAELEQIRKETSENAMDQLAGALLGMDFDVGMPSGVPAPDLPPPEIPLEETLVEAVIPEEEEEVVSFDEPWIETLRCTSCNDCLEINPKLFLYNGDKQAYLGDLSTATFQQLVIGAEKCPAKCIHPGKPLNPDEPGLEALMDRAAPFN